MTEELAGIILAGGRSERMGGRNKALIEIGDRPLIAHVIERLAPTVGALAISANADHDALARFGLPLIADPVPGHQGPLAGLLAGMEWAAANTPARAIVSVAVDTPFFPEIAPAQMLRAQNEFPEHIVLASSEGRLQPTFGLWPLSLRGKLRQHLETEGSRKMTDWARMHDAVSTEFSVRQLMGWRIEPFFNVNTPDDLEQAISFHLRFLS